MLSQTQREAEPEPTREADPAHHSEPAPSAEPEVEPEPTPTSEASRAEDRGSRGLGNVIGALFRRRA
jgi:hypothetical protein